MDKQRIDRPRPATVSGSHHERLRRPEGYVTLGRNLRTRWLTRENVTTIIGRIAVLLIVGGLWQLAGAYQIINPVFCGIPTRIVAEFINAITGPIFSVDAVSTVSAAITGAAGASVLGICSAFILAQSRTWRRIIDPYFTLLNGLPRVALAPLFLLLFGIGFTGKVTLAASITYFVTFYNTMAGVDSVGADHLVLAKALGASRLQLFLKFVVPSAVPSIFAGLQLGFVYGMLGTVASEMIAGQAGLGVVLTRQAALFQMDTYYATLLLLGIMTTAISGLLELIRVRILRWQRVQTIKV